MPRRVAAATLCLIAALEIAGCIGESDPAPSPRDEPVVSAGQSGAAADRLIFWAGCERVAELTDDELDFWEESGVDGFVCMVGRLRDLGGTQDFTGDEDAALTGERYQLQRTLRDSEIVERAEAGGMKLYLGAYLSNYNNTATPLVDWFDDEGWSQVALLRLADLAAAAELLGFEGLAFDQELYAQTGGVETASWEWNYPGNTHTEDEVRDAARQRGEQVMEIVLDEFPKAEFAVYNFSFPGGWNDLVREKVNDGEAAADDLLYIDFWDGMTSVEGYSAIRFYDSIFYKTPHVGTWEAALTYDVNRIYAAFSRGFENWEYASERVHLAPFSWLNEGPSEESAFDDAQSPEYVSEQLDAFRTWGAGGEFANFVYGGLDPAQYEDYRSAMHDASSPGTVDDTDPVLELAPTESRPVIAGAATDNLGIKAVRWLDDQGGSGVAELRWDRLGGNPEKGYEWEMRWSVPTDELSPDASEVTVTAEDIKGRTSAPVVAQLE